jgi:uncharacterized protein (DUF1684 family)
MRLRHLPAAALVFLTLPIFAQISQPDALTQWRAAYAKDLAQPDGWLALVALEWLQDGDTSIGSAPGNKLRLEHTPAHLGIVRQHSGRVEFLAPPEGVSSSVLVDGKPAAGGFLNSDDSPHPSEIVAGDVRITLIHRGDRFYLRVKDAYSKTRVHFRGLHWYAPNPRLRLTAKWVPYTPAKTVKILNVLGQASEEKSPGYAEFQIDGHTVRLDPLLEGDGLFFDFRDATGHTTTDGAGRFLTTALPSNGVDRPGTLVLDFNYAHNPPCGYTPYATCPLPPDQNRLTVSIPAGEKRYAEE